MFAVPSAVPFPVLFYFICYFRSSCDFHFSALYNFLFFFVLCITLFHVFNHFPYKPSVIICSALLTLFPILISPQCYAFPFPVLFLVLPTQHFKLLFMLVSVLCDSSQRLNPFLTLFWSHGLTLLHSIS